METPLPEPTESQVPTADDALLCPQCGQVVDASPERGAILECPACGAQFFRPGETADEPPTPPEESSDPADTEAELSELRIRQFITLRRSAYRTRSYLIVGALGCLGLAVQLVIFSVQDFQENHRIDKRLASCLFFAIAALIGSAMFGARVQEIQRQIIADHKAREAEEAEIARHPPDLSQLSDGSQHARNLQAMVSSSDDAGASQSPE